MVRRVIFFLLTVCLLAAVTPVMARTLEEVMAEMEKGAANLKDVKGTQIVKFMLEKEMVTVKNNFVAKTPNKFRAETSIPIPGTKKTQKVLTVCDGTTIWQETMAPEERKVIRMKLSDVAGKLDEYQQKILGSGAGMVGAEALVKLANADYDLKVTGQVTHGGKAMDVLEGKLKGSAKPGQMTLPTPAKIKYLVGAADGFVYKVEGWDKAGKSILEISYENIKFNTGVPDKTFSYTPPKKVEVVDAAEVAPYVIK
ncbi:MAG TPA: hypothetical protein PKX93_08705 [bacterium]|nr:hypothetical protein [bacterium]HOL67519.1 hypothetical protein [bacterium]